MIVLSSSLQDGMCYIMTANLDGETNLKVSKLSCALMKLKRTVIETSQLSDHPQISPNPHNNLQKICTTAFEIKEIVLQRSSCLLR